MITKIILTQLKKQVEKLSGLKNLEIVNFHINYCSEEFILTAKNNIAGKKLTKKVSDYSELSDILITKVNAAIKFNKIDCIDLNIDFVNWEQSADVYGANDKNENVKINLNNLI